MPRVRCHYIDCVFLEEGKYCAAANIDLDPDLGCLTYSEEIATIEDDEEEEEEDIDEWEDFEFEEEEEEDEDLWMDEEDVY
ncbi:MAG: hypothetical protein AB1345_02820 [Chloroflexota bacterium]